MPYVFVKFGFDTAENEPCKVCPIARCSTVRNAEGSRSQPTPPAARLPDRRRRQVEKATRTANEINKGATRRQLYIISFSTQDWRKCYCKKSFRKFCMFGFTFWFREKKPARSSAFKLDETNVNILEKLSVFSMRANCLGKRFFVASGLTGWRGVLEDPSRRVKQQLTKSPDWFYDFDDFWAQQKNGLQATQLVSKLDEQSGVSFFPRKRTLPKISATKRARFRIQIQKALVQIWKSSHILRI